MPLFTDSRAALVFWQRVAAGDLDAETTERLKEVAVDIVHAVFVEEYDHAARRAEATLKAVGWCGRLEKYPGLKDLATKLMPNEPASSLAEVADLIADIPPPSDKKEIKNRAKSIQQMRARTKKKE